LSDVEDLAPLYQGGMINQLDFSASAYQKIEGRRGFKWTRVSWDSKRIEPQYLMSRSTFFESETSVRNTKVVFRNIARTTDSRTFIGALINDLPTCNSIGLLQSADNLLLVSVLNSFTMDWVLRQRLAGTNLSLFLIQDLVAPRVSEMRKIRLLAAQLLLCHARFAQSWAGDLRVDRAWYSCWALSDAERLRCRAILEACLAHVFHLTIEDFKHMVVGCDYPVATLRSSEAVRSLDPRGFWRFQKDQNPEHGLAVLAQVAFENLMQLGFNNFLAQNEGVGWKLPETLRLTDYGLGHDDRAKADQPVGSALGPRLYDWQTEKSVKVSWDERDRHADILAKILHWSGQPRGATLNGGDDTIARDLFGNAVETDLFGEPVYRKSTRR
jgi:hypothetical protein